MDIENDQRSPTIQEIPDNTMQHIIHFLPIQDKLTMLKTCSRLRQNAKVEGSWSPLQRGCMHALLEHMKKKTTIPNPIDNQKKDKNILTQPFELLPSWNIALFLAKTMSLASCELIKITDAFIGSHQYNPGDPMCCIQYNKEIVNGMACRMSRTHPKIHNTQRKTENSIWVVGRKRTSGMGERDVAKKRCKNPREFAIDDVMVQYGNKYGKFVSMYCDTQTKTSFVVVREYVLVPSKNSMAFVGTNEFMRIDRPNVVAIDRKQGIHVDNTSVAITADHHTLDAGSYVIVHSYDCE